MGGIVGWLGDDGCRLMVKGKLEELLWYGVVKN